MIYIEFQRSTKPPISSIFYGLRRIVHGFCLVSIIVVLAAGLELSIDMFFQHEELYRT